MIRGGVRVVVTGGRDYADRDAVFSFLDALMSSYRVTSVACGDADGCDSLVRDWCRERRVTSVVFFADWRKHGVGAGPIRNGRMLSDYRPDVVVAFPGGSGTSDCVVQARDRGVSVTMVGVDGELSVS